MSQAKYKTFLHRNSERNKERELEEHRHMIKILKRERDKRIQQERTEKTKQGFNGLKSFMGKHMPPPQPMQPKPFSKMGVNRNGR